jgi:nucleotide-binding universal stress UspA family protein
MTEGSTSTPPRIVVGIDGSEASVGALQRAIRIATAMDGVVEAVTAWSYPPMFAGAAPSAWSPEEDAEALLQQTVQDAFPKGAPEWFSAHIAQGTPSQVLLEESRGAEMLVVGSRGRGGFRGLLLGSVSAAVAEYADCPVLIYHHEAKEVLHRDPPAH